MRFDNFSNQVGCSIVISLLFKLLNIHKKIYLSRWNYVSSRYKQTGQISRDVKNAFWKFRQQVKTQVPVTGMLINLAQSKFNYTKIAAPEMTIA